MPFIHVQCTIHIHVDLGPVSQKNIKSDCNRKHISGAKMCFPNIITL